MPKQGDKAPDVSPTDEKLERKAAEELEPKPGPRPRRRYKVEDAARVNARAIAGHYEIATDTYTHEPMIGPKRLELLARARGQKCTVRAKRTVDEDGTILFHPAVAERFAASWPAIFAASVANEPIKIPMRRHAKRSFGGVWRQEIEYLVVDTDGIEDVPIDEACDAVSRYPQFLEIDE